MYKTIALVGFLALVWIGYVAWPLYDSFALVRAIEDRNISTVTRHVDFGRVRASLTNQVIAAYVRRTGIVITPRQQQMAAVVSIADPAVSKLISAEALSDFLAVGWPVMVIPARLQTPSELIATPSGPFGRYLSRLNTASAGLKWRPPSYSLRRSDLASRFGF
jgi:hypothetical protein